MSNYNLLSSCPICLAILLCFSALCIDAQVPANKTFQVRPSDSEFGDYITEYDASYRFISTNAFEDFNFPFQVMFYNTTPDAYVFAIRAGTPREEDLFRWVWDANRNNPVTENATLTFGRDGNLVLAHPNGRVAWQTNTANKGVTGVSLLPNGNLVLHDSRGRFVWQSFDHPVDTLLIGMSLKINGTNRLVSRTSDAIGSDGKYSLVLEKSGLNLYLKESGQLLRYNGWRGDSGNAVTFVAVPENDNSTAYELKWEVQENPGTPAGRRLLQSRPAGILRKLNYNATLSFIRIESDGNLKAYTYYPLVSYLRWEESFSFFSDYFVRECGLPSKCGSYGLCEDAMCVACPSPKGLLGWSKSCAPPKVAACGGGSAAKVNYYRVDEAEHFLSTSMDNGEGPVKVEECRDRCTEDCKCRGFIYKKDTSKCLTFPVLGTLIRDNKNSTAYVKYSR